MSDISILSVELKQLQHAEGLSLPFYATKGSAGMDLQAAIDKKIIFMPGERKLVPTGISIALPDGYEAQIRPRSGLAYKHGITVLNSPGTIDSDYRGEIKVLLINLSKDSFEIERGMRIAQMVVASYAHVEFNSCNELEESSRGIGGFGSTGISIEDKAQKTLENA